MGERGAHSICIFLHEEQKPEPISSMPQFCISIHLTLLHPLQKSEAMIGTLLPCRYLRTCAPASAIAAQRARAGAAGVLTGF